jgi:hypothetical protein
VLGQNVAFEARAARSRNRRSTLRIGSQTASPVASSAPEITCKTSTRELRIRKIASPLRVPAAT